MSDDGCISREAFKRAQDEFYRVLDEAELPYRMGQLELFTDEEERYIQQEVERMLYDPKLPNAGKRERLWLAKLKEFSRDEDLVVVIKAAAGRYASALEGLLPRQEWIRRRAKIQNPKAASQTNEESEPEHPEEENSSQSNWLTLPGCYYTRKPISDKTNKSLFRAAIELKKECGRDMEKKWLAEFLLAGEPEAVSNFKMECLYLLRAPDGNVTRLVRLVNTLGEMSDGPEAGGTDILPAVGIFERGKIPGVVFAKGQFQLGRRRRRGESGAADVAQRCFVQRGLQGGPAGGVLRLARGQAGWRGRDMVQR